MTTSEKTVDALDGRIGLDNRRTLHRAVADTQAALKTADALRRGHHHSQPGDDRSGAVLRVLAPRVGVSAPPTAMTGKLPNLLRSLGIRSREVRLEPGWRTATEMPMIGRRTDGRVVALLPRGGRRGYRLFDPATGTTTPLTSSTTATLAPQALALYRSLPAGTPTARSLLSFAISGSGRDTAALLGTGLAFGLLALAVPASLGSIVPQLLVSGSSGFLWALLLIGTATATAGMVQLVRNAAVVRIQGRIQSRIEPAVWDRVLRHDASFFRQFSTGEIVQRGNAIAQIRKMLSDTVVGAVLAAFFSIASLSVLLVVSPALGAMVTGTLLLSGVVVAVLARRQQRHEAAVYDAYGEVYGLLYAVLLGIDKIQTAGREIQAFALWAKLFRRQKLADAAALRAQAGITAVTASLQAALVAAIVGGVAVFGIPVGVGDLVLAGAAAGQIALALAQLGQLASSASATGPLLRRLRPLLAEPERVGGDRDPGALTGEVALRGVSYRYPGAAESVLQSIDLVAAPGEMVAIVGPSGAGKSTIIRLLLGFQSPTGGTVEFSGQNLAELDIRVVRRQIGTVLQNAKLLSGTLLENIIGPTGDLGEAQAWDAADTAGIGEDLRRLPMGLATRIGENAEGLSGGQVQRLFIARALVRNPAVLLFDEATSALDNLTQHLVSERIAELPCTRIVIAHRLSTIRRADRIYVLDGGRIEASGSYDELLTESPVFARLVARQEAQR